MPEGSTTNPFTGFIGDLMKRPEYSGQVVHIHRVPERPAVFGGPMTPLSDQASAALGGMGINWGR